VSSEGTSVSNPGLFSEEKNLIKNMKKIFLMGSASAAKKFGRELEDQQQILLAMADVLIEIYLSESAVLRAEKNSKASGDNKEKQIAMVQLYLFHAIELVQIKAREAILS